MMQAAGDNTTTLNGTVAIHQGQVLVTNPREGGKPAVITPGDHAQVLVNGSTLTGPKQVTAEDEIKLIPDCSAPDWQLNIRVSSDKMNVYARIDRTPGSRYRIFDHGPAHELTVKAELEELIKPEITTQEVIQLLQAKGIVHGIMPEMVQLAIASEQNSEYLVAQGVPPVPGIDAEIRLVFAEKPQKNKPEEAPLIHLHDVISVEPGELLAEVIPPQPGKSGVDVYGNPVLPPAPKNIILAAGNGAEVNKEGTRAKALIAGRPVLSGHTVTVYPSYTLNGDVDAKTGQVLFKGDVIIQGNVLDGMKVEASGKVVVNGYVANATIIGGGDVVIHQNLVGGTVRAGGVSAICQRLIASLTTLQQYLMQLVPAITQLKKHPTVSRNRDLERLGDGVLVKMLLDTKFKQIPAVLKEIEEDLEKLVGAVESKELDYFRKSFSDFTKKFCARVPLELKTVALIQEFCTKFTGEIKNVSQVLKERAREKAKLSVPYVQNSHLESSGDVYITGKGCYSSNIYAGGNVLIYGSPGVFRGGEIIAGGNIKVRELGSQAEAITLAQVGKDRTITVDRAYPGVTIKAGARVEKINSVTHGLILEGI